MFNLPVKLSVMSTPYSSLSPQVFLDLTPEKALTLFLETLPEWAGNTLAFAFTPEAILLLLEREFEVRVAKRQMVFLKPALDSQSWLLANGLLECPSVPAEVEHRLEMLTEHLWSQTAPFSPATTPLDERIGLRREIKTLFLLYYLRHGHQKTSSLDELTTFKGISRFLNLVVVEAMYKADGARVLFGRDSDYYRLWLEKQHQFYAYAAHIGQPIAKKIA